MKETDMPIDKVYERYQNQIKSLTEEHQYVKALELISSCMDEFTVDKNELKNYGEVDAPALFRYISMHQGEPFCNSVEKTASFLLFAVCYMDISINTLGCGQLALEVLHRATAEAEKYPQPFSEWFMSSSVYDHMMWFLSVESDKQKALTYAYSLKPYMKDQLDFEHRCEEIKNCNDWDVYRASNKSYMFVDSEEWDRCKRKMLAGNPYVDNSFECAVYDSVLTSLEQRKGNGRNDNFLVRVLLTYCSALPSIIENIPCSGLNRDEIREIYDYILHPITDHVIYHARHITISTTPSPYTLLFRRLNENSIAMETKSYRILTDASSGIFPEEVREKKVIGDLFTTDIIKEKRVFLSSSFKDMHAERDYLLTHTFPKLDLFLRTYGTRLSVVDLRGTSQECESEAYNRETFKNCLDEVDSCRPMMIGLIGDRYGWIPYENADDPVMTAVVEKTAREHGLSVMEIMGKSMTHLEMLYGLRVMDLKRCYFYFRNINLINGATTEDLRKNGFYEERWGAEDIDTLKDMLMDAYGVRKIAPSREYGNHTQYYEADYDGKYISNLKGLGDNIYRVLLSDIINEVSKKRSEEKWYMQMLNFWDEAAHNTLPHPLLNTLIEYDESEPLLITGPEGIGKTVLLAQLWASLRDDAIVIPVEMMLDDESNNIDNILKRLSEYEKYLIQKFAEEHPGRKPGKTVVIIDGIEKALKRGDVVKLSEKLAEALSKNVKWIFCGTSRFTALSKGYKNIHITDPPADGEKLIRNAAFRHGKRLDGKIIPLITEAAKKGNDNPLYIDYLVTRVMSMLQQDFDGGDHIEWMKSIIESTDGDLGAAAMLTVNRARAALDENHDYISDILNILINSSDQCFMTAAEIVQVLEAKGVFGEKPKGGLFGMKALTQYNDRIDSIMLECFNLLRPVLVFDSTCTKWAINHYSLIKEWKGL